MDELETFGEAKFYQCVDCDYASAIEPDLQEHNNEAHALHECKAPEPNGQTTSTNNKDVYYKCQHCNYEAKRKSTLEYHTKLTHVNPAEDIFGSIDPITSFKCNTCEYITKKACHLREHIKAVHDKIKDFKCLLCPYASSYKSQLKNHKKKRHQKNGQTISEHLDKTKKYKCHVCPYRAKQNGHLKDHIKIVHNKIRDFKCHLCAFETSRKSKLERHITSHHKGINLYDSNKYSLTTRDPCFSTKTMHSEHSQVPESIYNFEKENGIKLENDDNDIEGEGQNEIDKNVNIKKVLAINFTKRNGKFRCNPCGKFFTRLHSVNDHINSHHVGTHQVPTMPCFSGL